MAERNEVRDPKEAGAKQKQTQHVTVTLKKEHTHKGVLHIPGSRIELRPDQAEILSRQGVV